MSVIVVVSQEEGFATCGDRATCIPAGRSSRVARMLGDVPLGVPHCAVQPLKPISNAVARRDAGMESNPDSTTVTTVPPSTCSSVNATGPGGHPNSPTCGRVKLPQRWAMRISRQPVIGCPSFPRTVNTPGSTPARCQFFRLAAGERLSLAFAFGFA